jgi:drug/metabolite transporter (DMT)-like permease
MLSSVFTFTLMQSLARYLGPTVSSWTKTFYRCLFSTGFVFLWMIINKRKWSFNNIPLLLVRSITGAVAIAFFFWTIDLVSLIRATLYAYSYPVFAIVFAATFYKEKFFLWMLVPLLCALGGLYLIVNPTLDGFSVGDIIGISGGIFGGIARATVRELRKTDSPADVVLFFMFATTVLTAFVIILLPSQDWHITVTPRLGIIEIWAILIGIGFFSAVSHALMTAAFRRLSTAVGSIMTILIIPATAVVAATCFHESLRLREISGGIMIIASVIVISLFGNRRSASI